MKIYAQIIDSVINLIGGKEVGLPLPQDFLDRNLNIQCVEITDLEKKPVSGDYYIDGVFYTADEWYEKIDVYSDAESDEISEAI